MYYFIKMRVRHRFELVLYTRTKLLFFNGKQPFVFEIEVVGQTQYVGINKFAY